MHFIDHKHSTMPLKPPFKRTLI